MQLLLQNVRKFKRNFLKRNKRVTCAIIVIITVVVCLFFYVDLVTKTRADAAIFYPTTCLGGWKNAALAEGKPDITSADTPFSLKNSAFSSNDSVSQIFCGGFQGNIIENTEVKKIIIHFSWAQTDIDPVEVIPATITGSNFASSTNDIISNPNAIGSQFILQPEGSIGSPTPTSSDHTTNKVKLENPSIEPEILPVMVPKVENITPQPATKPVPATGSVTSFLNLVTEKVYADGENILSATDTSLTAPGSLASSTIDIATTSDISNSKQEALLIQSNTDTSDEPFLKIQYTIDGTNWKILGTVTRNNFAGKSFELPVSDFASWADLSQLQISVERIATVNKSPHIYLDGMYLEIPYEKKIPVTVPNEDLTKKILHFTTGVTTNDIISSTVKIDNTKMETLSVLSKIGGSLKVYGVTDPLFSMVIGIGGDAVEFPGYSFPPGKYFIIITSQRDACSGMSLYECASDKGFIDKLDFSVVEMPKIKNAVIE
jgi:hypothetical protein